MKRKNAQIFIVFSVLVALTAGLLLRVRANYVLGEPGLIVADVPMYVAFDKHTNILSTNGVVLPEQVLDYTSVPVHVTSSEVQMLPPDTLYGRRVYQGSDGLKMMISVVLMGTDRTSIHKPQYCLTGQGETILHSEVISIPIAEPHPYNLELMKLTTAAERHVAGGQTVPTRGLYLYWFVADGQLTPHHGERMWLMGKELLTKGRLQRWAYVAYWGICSPGQEDALLGRMKKFIAASVPEFQKTTGEETSRAAALEFTPRFATRN
jgi:hypothetical protein